MKKPSIFFLIAFCIFLGACNDSDGNDDPTPIIEESVPTSRDAVFKVFPDNYFELGYKETYQMTGSNSQAEHYSVDYSYEAGDLTTMRAIPVREFKESYTVTVANAGSWKFDGRLYFTTDKNARQLLCFIDDEYEYIPVVTYALPHNVKIGDSGTIGTYDVSDGSKETLSYSVTDAKNGYVNFIIKYTFTDSSGNPDGTEKHSYVIDQQGNRLSMAIHVTGSDNLSLNVSGPRTN